MGRLACAVLLLVALPFVGAEGSTTRTIEDVMLHPKMTETMAAVLTNMMEQQASDILRTVEAMLDERLDERLGRGRTARRLRDGDGTFR